MRRGSDTLERWLAERVTPAKPREASEVGIVGMDLGLVLHGEGGDVRIRH